MKQMRDPPVQGMGYGVVGQADARFVGVPPPLSCPIFIEQLSQKAVLVDRGFEELPR
jgi:hypothetical protein